MYWLCKILPLLIKRISLIVENVWERGKVFYKEFLENEKEERKKKVFVLLSNSNEVFEFVFFSSFHLLSLL